MDVMKALFLNPPSYEDFDGGAGSRYQATREVWSFWYPTWLAYPAGMIPGARLLDAPPHNYDVAMTVAEAKAYDLVVLHTSTPSLRNDVRTAEAIKAANPNAIIAFVGGHPTAAPEEVLKLSPAIDIAGRKEFDYSMVEVAQGLDWAKIGGISYQRNGVITHNPERPILTGQELDKLPFVSEVYEKNLDYLRYNSPYCQYPYVSLYTGRGCPAQCTFCLWPQVTQGHRYRTRSPENVYEEVSMLKAKFPKMKELFFDDDTFTADAKRARRIAELLKPLGLTWSTNSRANVDYETLRLMKESGLRLFVVGYETGNAQILKNIKKGVSLEQARRFTRDCHKLGILIHGTFILGLPGESTSTIEESIRFAREMDCETIQVSLASPYPGTELFKYVVDNGFLAVDPLLDESGYQKCTVRYPGLSSQEIYAAVERFYRSFYFRPKYIFKAVRKMATSTEECKRLLKEGRQFLSTMRQRRVQASA
ncbi:MAG TPA: hopanoid biosynthesis associated radical SAM protein HpnJ [Candidatus Binataceae bacterium]|nr:hopanoid biosynthesis associated radical SAM protein HpnJ [Candidatus Binataceae bacterium]